MFLIRISLTGLILRKKPKTATGFIEFLDEALVDRWQPLLFGSFLVIGCQKVQNRLFNGYETVK